MFDVVVDPATNAATWTNISFDIGDQPVNDAVLDTATGDIYVSTDFGVLPARRRHADVGPGGDGMPVVTVSGLTLAAGKQRRPPALRGDARPQRVPPAVEVASNA